jgi:mannose-6-phosphate isomerase-like protein (cupin superfamily)
MSDYAIKNLMDIEDLSEREEVDVRFARKYLDSEHLGISHFRYGPGYRAEMGHRHGVQEEAYVVVGGSGRIKLDDEIVELRKWDVVRVAPPVARSFEGGPEGLEIIAVGSDRPEDGDGERIEGHWPPDSD